MAKGIAIIAVVYGHCTRGLEAAGLLEPSSLTSFMDYLFYSFHIPTFFVISGYFFRKVYERDRGEFLPSRVQTIVYPYFLWSIIHGCIQIALSKTGAVNEPITAGRLAMILWLPIAPYWFLYSLFFANVIAMATNRFRPETCFAGSVIAAAICVALLIPTTIADIAYGCTFFFLGAIFAKYKDRLLAAGNVKTLPVFFVLFLAAAGLGFLLGIPLRLQFIASVLGVWCVLTGAIALEAFGRNILVRALVVAGQYSMGIFVMHILVLGLVRFVLSKVHMDHIAVLIPASIVLATVVPIFIQMAAEKLQIGAFLGFARTHKKQAVASVQSTGKQDVIKDEH